MLAQRIFRQTLRLSLGAAVSVAAMAVLGLQLPTAAAPKKVTSATVPLPTLAPWHRRPAALGKGPSKVKASPSSPASPELPPADIWSSSDVNDALQSCVLKLAAIQAKVDIATPFKKGPCGAPSAIRVSKLGSRHALNLSPAATLRCKMAASLYRFIEDSLQPAAIEILGSPVESFRGISSYSCRNRNGAKTGRLSEHALANALDVGNFKLKNGKTVSVLKHWGPTLRDKAVASGAAERPLIAVTGKERPRRPLLQKASLRRNSAVRVPPVPIKRSVAVKRATSKSAAKLAPTKTKRVAPPAPSKPVRVAKETAPTKEELFLKRVHKEACQYFGTVLGPEANEAHRDHFHFDMAARRRNNYCQ